jgi:hypothetical protein
MLALNLFFSGNLALPAAERGGGAQKLKTQPGRSTVAIVSAPLVGWQSWTAAGLGAVFHK